MIRFHFSLIIFALCLIGAQAAQAEGLSVQNAYAFATTAAQANGAIFMDIHNGGAADDALTSVKTDIARTAEIHIMEMKEGTMVMRPVEKITVPANGQAQLAPTGTHVMLMGLTRPLQAGSMFDATLTFEKAGNVPVQVHIVPAGDTSRSESHAHDAQPIPQDSTADWFHNKSGLR